MSTTPNHYDSAEMLMALADHTALAADEAIKTDPMVGLAKVAGAVVHLLAAQVHATLAVADAITREASS